MDTEIHAKYRTLLVQHLERDEVEFELEIRGVKFEEKDSLPVLRSRLREKLKEANDDSEELEFEKCKSRSVDEEIRLIDENLVQIRDCLKKEEGIGVREEIRTRLVHYFARCLAILHFAEEEDDLEDLDNLLSTIRRLYAIDSIRREVKSQLLLSTKQVQSDLSEIKRVSRGTQTE